MEKLQPILTGISSVMSLCSVLILVWGVIVSMWAFLKSRFSKTTMTKSMYQISIIKNSLGAYVLLSLEVLIAADIIETIVKPTMEDIIRLAAIVAIRTVISYFLNKEIMETKELIDEENKEEAQKSK